MPLGQKNKNRQKKKKANLIVDEAKLIIGTANDSQCHMWQSHMVAAD